MIISETQFSREFKIKAITEHIVDKRSVEEIASQYHIPEKTLLQWIDIFYDVFNAETTSGTEVSIQDRVDLLFKKRDLDYHEYVFGKIILDKMDTIVNICDMDTHEILFMNKSCQERFGVTEEEYKQTKCYELFYDEKKPCSFCTNNRLTKEKIVQWSVFNTKLKKHYELTDRMIYLNGRALRMEIGTDVDTRETQIKEMDGRILLDRTLFTCIRTLTDAEDIDHAINKILELVCIYHMGTRGYIFELSDDGTLLNNTYEWHSPGISAEIDNLQNIPKAVAADWFTTFEEKGSFFISSLGEDLDTEAADYRILEAQGIESLMAVPLIENGQIRGFIGVDDPTEKISNFELLQSISFFILNDMQKRHMFTELERLGFIDALTQVYNRNKYIHDLEKFEQRRPASMGVVYIDLNGLKVANDQFGHHYGDYILKRIARLMVSVFGSERVYRIGGDEFVIFCANYSNAQFNQAVGEFRASVDEVKDLTASVGTAWEEKSYSTSKLVKHADDLMYANKQQYYESIQVADYNYNTSLTKHLLDDIATGRYLVYLQPKVTLSDGSICGAEALIRGTDKDGGLVRPDYFIPMLESHGLIRHIDFFVLETVCKLIQELKAKGKTIGKVSVNFSRVTLLELDVTKKMMEICQRYETEPGEIIIEVTESTAKLQQDELAELVTKIRAKGFSISLDDYGTKYSNMSALLDVCFDEIKLDQSITSKAPVSERMRKVIEYTVKTLKELNMCDIVAEGIETAEEYEIAKQYGCDYGQGYHFSPPIPISEFLEKYYSE